MPMATNRQSLGAFGENVVASLDCFRCKRSRTLKQLPPNFKCADIICDFCGYLAQVKTSEQADVTKLPRSLMGAAWGPQNARMQSGIFFSLFIVLVSSDRRSQAVYYLPAELQTPAMFQQRNALSATAKRSGWVGYTLRLDTPGAYQPVLVR